MIFCVILMSLPTRGRGLKYQSAVLSRAVLCVAPYAGAWIEIYRYCIENICCRVAPYAGAWIEIELTERVRENTRSLPTRGRGLKYI